MNAATTWRALWRETTDVLGHRAEARWLCEHASGLDGDDFLAGLDEAPTQRMVAELDAMVARYRSGEPLQYVLGRWAFRTLDLLVDRRVLIPRPETELVAEVALSCARARPAPRTVVDLGAGSGAIGLSLAAELALDSAVVWLTDASPDALDVARANLAGLGRFGGGVRLVLGDWFSALPPELAGRVDVVVSNPPYIAEGDPEMSADVADWEPEQALLSGPDGLDAIRRIVADAPAWLAPRGWLVLEIGHRQGDAVADILRREGFVEVEIRPDLAGCDRIAVARMAALSPDVAEEGTSS